MRVNARITVIMRDIQHVTVSIRRHTNTADVTIGHGIHFFPFHALRLDVEAGMDVVGANLAESGGEVNRDVQRLAVLRK